MREAVIVAVVAAWPPTLAALLAFLAARASDRRSAAEGTAATAQSLDHLSAAVGRVEAAVEHVESGVCDLRERVARLEGPRQPVGGA